MKLSKEQYDDLIRKRPSLAPSLSKPLEALVKGCVEALRPIPVPVAQGLCFTIKGQPMGKPRMTQRDKWAKRPCVLRYRAWADLARASVPPGATLSIYREIYFVAYLEFPKSYSKAKRKLLAGQPHLQKPDCDNLLKCFDALFADDKLIWKVGGEKRWEDRFGARMEVRLY